jgi:hypothetical protein
VALEREGRQLDDVGGPLVVVGPGLVVRAEHERAAGHEHVRRHLHVFEGRRRVLDARELDRLQHRLLVLELVLGDQAVDVRVALERIGVVERHVLEHLQRVAADALEVGARLARGQDRQPRAFRARVPERVVDVVEPLALRFPAEATHEPELLEPADVREVPDERRHQRRDLREQELVVERLDQPQRRLARPLQRRDDVRLRRVAYRGAHESSGEGGIRVVP